MSYNTKIKRNFKDSVFAGIFGDDPEALLDLYNALNGTSYTDPAGMRIVTIDDALLVAMPNDVAFVFAGVISLYEHQSTPNKNMPLRMFCYIAEEYQSIAASSSISIHSSALIKLPTPKLVVFYNGTEPADDVTQLRLSDAFENRNIKPDIELTVTVVNINHEHNRDLLGKCHLLAEYSEFVYTMRKADGNGDSDGREQRLMEAIDSCIKNGILSEYLREWRSELIGSLLREFDREKYEYSLRVEGFEKGLDEGFASGQRSGIIALLKKFSPEKVAELLEIPIEAVLEAAESTH